MAREVRAVRTQVRDLTRQADAMRVQVGSLQAHSVQRLAVDQIADSEFRVFSQFGEDGILQFLLCHVPISNETFVEFGVQDYSEANTRFILLHNNWRGLIIDGGDAHVQATEAAGLDWQYHLDALQAFIDRDNINQVIGSAGVEGDIGLLSVDIDGNDYWVLERIDCVSPRILVVEYNSIWGSEAAVTVPYDSRFRRSTAHSSNLYWGASLRALTNLANRRGYALVGGNRAGNNAFYVRRDVLDKLPERSVESVYAPSRFRESLDSRGRRTYLSDHRGRLAVIADMILWDFDTSKPSVVRERYDL